MRWLQNYLPDLFLKCVYCGRSDKFPHSLSYEHNQETLSLYKCTSCSSLIYDLAKVETGLPALADFVSDDVMISARYYIEAGFSARHIAMCALAALPDISPTDMHKSKFVDVGAGFGIASYLVKMLFGMTTVTIEPSFMGKLSHELLGLDVHRVYFENLPAELLEQLKTNSCYVQLNSVVEHLVDPFSVLKDMLDRAVVDRLAVIVPNAAFLSIETPFVFALPFLSPRDHRHLPSREGIERLLRRLNFEFVHVHVEDGLLTAVGSRTPIAFPSERTIALAEQGLLHHLARHPNHQVAEGGFSRLLPVAVGTQNDSLMAELRKRAPYEEEADAYLNRIERRLWPELPFHLGPTCYFLAWDALQNGRLEGALSLLAITRAFADAFSEAHPDLAMFAVQCSWEAIFLKAEILMTRQEPEKARAALREIISSRLDKMNGATSLHVERAKVALTRMADLGTKEPALSKINPTAATVEVGPLQAGDTKSPSGSSRSASTGTTVPERLSS